MNSFRNIHKAINYEVKRQIEIVEEGGKVVQESRLWDANAGVSQSMRSKEEANDYRYFPDPDLPPLVIDQAFIEGVRRSLPELPGDKKLRFVNDYKIPAYDAGVICASKSLADFFEEVVSACDNPKMTSNFIMSELMRELKIEDIDVTATKLTPFKFANLMSEIGKGTISGKMAKDIFLDMYATGRTPDEIIKEKGLVQISDEGELIAIIDEIVAANPKEVEKYQGGNVKLIGFFVGEAMKRTKGKANPNKVNEILLKKLAG
jgi:aspartyl-tRNA(Asn)/glutamyl-tRNA(Gln) amidotransferase subunit B